MDILETHIEEIVSPFLNKMTGRHANLTPREIQIAGLVKDGKTSKEIARILGIAENHRDELPQAPAKEICFEKQGQKSAHPPHVISVMVK